MDERCKICGVILNQVGEPFTEDCGGDCLSCMAEAGDPEAVQKFRKLEDDQ